jgi:hypothetical protein
MDEHSIHSRQALTGETSTARILIFMRNHCEKRIGMRTMWWPPDVHQHGGDVNPSEEGLVRLPLRGLENSTCAPSSWGGGGQMCNMQVRPCTSSRWRYGLRKTLLAQLGGLRWKPGTRIIVRGMWKIRIGLLYVGGLSGTLLVVNIGRTPLPSPDSNHGDTSL